jgi:ATP-dependent Clp protease ATP-binding subunit ClpB
MLKDISLIVLCQTSIPLVLFKADQFRAVDLVDEACSKLRLQQESKPEKLENLDRSIVTMQIELESLKKETDPSSIERRQLLETDLQQRLEESRELNIKWKEEK